MMTRFDDREAAARRPIRVHVRGADLSDPADGAALLMLLDAYARDPMGDGRPLGREARHCLIPALRRVSGALVLLAFAHDGDGGPDWQPAGAAVCFSGFSTFRARCLLNVHDLTVLPEWRRCGIAGRLLAAVEADARMRGCCKVTLEVRADNAVARRLYQRLGYGAGGSGDDPVQYLFMEKRLAD
jgi:GNAT superfamily N-acetyltransferase